MKTKHLKPLPRFASDEEAEHFVDHADLTKFNLSNGRLVRFQMNTPEKILRDDVTYAFEIYKDQSDDFHFRFKASNGEVLFTSEGYKTKNSALRALETVKRNLGDVISKAATKV